jgi:Leucine-rich repeat (LRR) protein
MKAIKYFLIILPIFFILNCKKDSPTDSGTIDSFYWEISAEQVIGPEGGTLTDPTTGATLEVPAGALADETSLVMGPAYNMPIDNSIHIPTSEYYIGPENIEFLIPVTITIPYNEAELPSGVTEDNLQMHRYNMDKDRVITQNSTIDINNNTISALTRHFSFYVPGGDIPPHSVILENPSNVIDNSVTLYWTLNVDGDYESYKLYYGLQANVNTNNILLNQITNRYQNIYTISGLNPATNYYFKIYTYDANGLVTESNEVMTTTDAQSVVVTFNDTNLERVIRESLSKPTGDITNADLATITSLDGDDSRIVDITVLKYCTNLEWLYLSNNLISDLTPLSGLIELEGLYIDNNNISDIHSFITLENLENLTLGHNQISDIRPIQYLVDLEYLSLEFNNVEDVKFIRNMPSLRWLYLSYNNISSISGLRNLPNLETLGISYNSVDNIGRLSDFPLLANFYAEGNNISNLNPLTNHANLYNVDLDYNQIVDIGPLADNHPNLRYLYLQHNNITEVPSMVNLTNLYSFYISYNQINNIDGLSGQTAVQYLFMYNNNIVDISSLATVTNIYGLGLSYNIIVDIEPLVNNTGLDNGDYIYMYS